MRRFVLGLGAAAYVVAVLAWLGRDPRLAQEAYDDDSIYNRGPRGASLAFEYLRRRGGPRVAPSTFEFAAARLEADAVLFRLGVEGPWDAPPEAPEDAPLLTPAETAWVEGGGRLVLAPEGTYRAIEVAQTVPGRVEKVFPTWPGVRELAPERVALLGGEAISGGHAILAAGERPVAVRLAIGRGDVVVLGLFDVLRNERLGDADHLALLEALAGSGRPVHFDETVHGLEREVGVTDILRRWGLGPLIALAGVLGVAAAWRRNRRLGPPDLEAGDSRREAVDLVDSLAVLYERALTREKAVRLYREHLAKAASLRTGLAGDALEAWVTRWIRTHGGEEGTRRLSRRPGFKYELERLNRAFRELEHVERR